MNVVYASDLPVATIFPLGSISAELILHSPPQSYLFDQSTAPVDERLMIKPFRTALVLTPIFPVTSKVPFGATRMDEIADTLEV